MNKFPSVMPWNPDNGIPAYKFAKRDGHQMIVSRDQFGTIAAWTRTPTDITSKVPWALECLYDTLPNNVVLAGELWLPGSDHSAVKTAIKEQNRRLRWDAFAILKASGIDAFTSCEVVEQWFCRYGVPHVGYHYPTTTCVKAFEQDMLEQQMKIPDVEGWILKDANLLNISKWKPELTIDLIITGHEDSEKGKWLGLLGALVCSTKEGYEVAKVSGMSDSIRYELSVNTDQFIGRVIEVEYQSVGTKGRLRHPRFNRFRDDKAADDCSCWQDERLVRYWHGVR